MAVLLPQFSRSVLTRYDVQTLSSLAQQGQITYGELYRLVGYLCVASVDPPRGSNRRTWFRYRRRIAKLVGDGPVGALAGRNSCTNELTEAASRTAGAPLTELALARADT